MISNFVEPEIFNDWTITALGCWAVREHFISGAYPKMYFSDCLQILHTTPGGLVVPFGIYPSTAG